MNAKVALVAAVSVTALSGAVFAFLANASPYVTVAQAKVTEKADNLHLKGDILTETVEIKPQARTCEFVLKDDHGQTMQVVSSDIPPNMGEATMVVAVGGMEGEIFKARKLLVKCPSKYQSENGDNYGVASK